MYVLFAALVWDRGAVTEDRGSSRRCEAARGRGRVPPCAGLVLPYSPAPASRSKGAICDLIRNLTGVLDINIFPTVCCLSS